MAKPLNRTKTVAPPLEEKRASTRTSPGHRTFFYKIAILRRLLDRSASSDMARLADMTLAEWRLLTNLYSSAPVNARQLCLQMHADKAEVSRACAGLIARGYAVRRPDQADRRSAAIAITPEGERIHDMVVPSRVAVQQELEAALGESDAATLHRILDRLVSLLSDQKAEGRKSPRADE